MENVTAFVDFVLRHEDAKLSGVITRIQGDSGGRTRFGIAERWHPELTSTGFYTTMRTYSATNSTAAQGYLENSYITPSAGPVTVTRSIRYCCCSHLHCGPASSG
jgi:hypothetical protein